MDKKRIEPSGANVTFLATQLRPVDKLFEKRDVSVGERGRGR